MNTTTTWDYDYPTSEYESYYCNSVLECTDQDKNLSLANAKKLCADHGATYEEFTSDVGISLNALQILDWLGY